MASGQVMPASICATSKKRAARATWAPGFGSAQGAPATPCSTARPSSSCQDGWNEIESTLAPARS